MQCGSNCIFGHPLSIHQIWHPYNKLLLMLRNLNSARLLWIHLKRDHLPPILQRGYFGPRWGKPKTTTSRPAKKQKPTTTEHIIHTKRDIEDIFPEFDPFIDVKAGHMVAMNTNNEDRESGIPFFLGKVAVLKNVSSTSGSMKIKWYWSKPTS